MRPEPHELTHGWRMAVTAAGACASPTEAATLDDWIAADVPGTAAAALEKAGRWSREAPQPLHDKDVWYRLELAALGRGTLTFDGLATLAEAWLDEAPLFASRSMFAPAEAAVDLSRGGMLWICFRALEPALTAKGPRARWRPPMIERQGLRLIRTTLLGHMPGWCPAIDIVGPWRPVRFTPDGALHIGDLRVTADWDSGARLAVGLAAPGLTEPPTLVCADAACVMQNVGGDLYRGELAPAAAQAWQPHTHGPQPLYPIELQVGAERVELCRTGFRRLRVERGDDSRGFALEVNGAPVFCRGACWITPDLVALGGRREDYEPTLRLAREAGFNMVRVSGVGLYETRAFFEICDELGLLVWQDFMFANFDYPTDPSFLESVRTEARAALAATQGSPSLAVLCGGSEVMQQAAMMGLPAMDWPIFDDLLADEAARLRPDAPYVPNTPCGGPLPFSVGEGVAHYYGVGAYLRPLEDARRSGVRFAAECLAFANLPQPPAGLEARPPRDRGASWDFADVRDHYLARVFGVSPPALRREDPALYLDLSRAVSGEVMAAVFTEWRRARSPCAGGLVWTLRDLAPGAGWGLIDAEGEPKPAWYALKRLLQPVSVGLTDEGVDGLAVHLFNDRPMPVRGELQLCAYDGEVTVMEVRRELTLAPRSAIEISAFELIGRFFDIAYAYRFGPRSHAAVAARLSVKGDLVAEATHFLDPAAGLRPGDVEARLEAAPDGWRLALTSARLLRYVHVETPGWRCSDDGFPLAPGVTRRLALRPLHEGAPPPAVQVWTAGGHLVGAGRNSGQDSSIVSR